MSYPKTRSQLAISEAERTGLVELFDHFLRRLESRGAGSADLEALLAILETAGGEGVPDADLGGLRARLIDLQSILVPERLTLAEAARVFGVKADTLRRACWSGGLPGEKRGKTWFVRVADLQQYLSPGTIQSGGVPMFDNDEPEDRERLIAALQAVGLDASEFESGGGITHVIVPLIDPFSSPPQVSARDLELRTKIEAGLGVWPKMTSLYIASNSLRTACEVGLFGDDGRTGAQVSSPEWPHADSLEEAVALFREFWDERDRWLRIFLAGDLS